MHAEYSNSTIMRNIFHTIKTHLSPKVTVCDQEIHFDLKSRANELMLRRNTTVASSWQNELTWFSQLSIELGVGKSRFVLPYSADEIQ